MARRKQDAVADVPQTTMAAIALLDEYRSLERDSLRDRIIADVVICETKRQLAERLAEREIVQKIHFAALKAWWEAGGKDMAGKARSADLAGTKLGVRLTPPKVKFGKGIKADAIVDWLKRVVGGKPYLRTTVELDKQAVIKVVQAKGPMAEPLAAQGVTVIQTDEFFIDTGLDTETIRKELGD